MKFLSAQAPPTTPLFDRIKAEGRLVENSDAISNFSAPNFRTTMPLPALLRGLSRLLADLYDPKTYFERSRRSLEAWQPRPFQKPKYTSPAYDLHSRLLHLASGRQIELPPRILGISGRLLRRYRNSPSHIWMGFSLMLSAHHFLIYSRHVSEELERDCAAAMESAHAPALSPEFLRHAG